MPSIVQRAPARLFDKRACSSGQSWQSSLQSMRITYRYHSSSRRLN